LLVVRTSIKPDASDCPCSVVPLHRKFSTQKSPKYDPISDT